jgi:hypothetical protein
MNALPRLTGAALIENSSPIVSETGLFSDFRVDFLSVDQAIHQGE